MIDKEKGAKNTPVSHLNEINSASLQTKKVYSFLYTFYQIKCDL